MNANKGQWGNEERADRDINRCTVKLGSSDVCWYHNPELLTYPWLWWRPPAPSEVTLKGQGHPGKPPAHRLPSHLQYPPTAHICLHSFSSYPAYPQLLLLSQHILTHNSGENLLLHQRPCLLPEPLLWWRTTCWTKGHAPTFRTLASNLDRNILLDQRIWSYLTYFSDIRSPVPNPDGDPLLNHRDYPGQKTKEKTEKKGTKHASNKDKKRNQHLDL